MSRNGVTLCQYCPLRALDRGKNESVGLKEILEFLLFTTAQDGVTPLAGGRVSC
jgi:hypothetical protein